MISNKTLHKLCVASFIVYFFFVVRYSAKIYLNLVYRFFAASLDIIGRLEREYAF